MAGLGPDMMDDSSDETAAETAGAGRDPHEDEAAGEVVGVVVGVDDPRADDVRALLERHLAYAQAFTPAEGIHVLDVEALSDPTITFFSARRHGELLGVGALKQLDPSHAELKSMHTVEAARRSGVGRALVEHILAVAADRNCRRVSLETGVMDAFAPARALYAEAGFEPCGPFGEYVGSPTSACMTITIGRSPAPATNNR